MWKILVCFFRLSFLLNVSLQILHEKVGLNWGSFSTWTLSKCLLRFSLLLNVSPHWLHSNLVLTPWTAVTCLSSLYFLLKTLSHSKQGKYSPWSLIPLNICFDLSMSWTSLRCWFRLSFRLNLESHRSQLYSTVDSLWQLSLCFFKLRSKLNWESHRSHKYFVFCSPWT